MKKEDDIDYTSGIVLEKRIGEYVNIGETIAYIHVNKKDKIEEAIERVKKAYKIEEERPDKYKDILNII